RLPARPSWSIALPSWREGKSSHACRHLAVYRSSLVTSRVHSGQPGTVYIAGARQNARYITSRQLEQALLQKAVIETFRLKLLNSPDTFRGEAFYLRRTKLRRENSYYTPRYPSEISRHLTVPCQVPDQCQNMTPGTPKHPKLVAVRVRNNQDKMDSETSML
ncbi:hypothetical protein RRG08_059988, partial [Elysia crispata]